MPHKPKKRKSQKQAQVPNQPSFPNDTQEKDLTKADKRREEVAKILHRIFQESEHLDQKWRDDNEMDDLFSPGRE